MARRSRRVHDDDENESYFVSLSDLMAGVLFLFIIMLTYFGLELRKTADTVVASHAKPKPTDAVAKVVAPPTPGPAPVDLRTALLQRLESDLTSRGSPAKVDIGSGSIRIPNAVLFGPGGTQLTPAGSQALTGVAIAMARIFPCVASSTGLSPPPDCPTQPGRLASVSIEGHAGAGPDTVTQSAVQAAGVYRGLIAAQPALQTLRTDPNNVGPPVISVAGYASGAGSDEVEIRVNTTG